MEVSNSRHQRGRDLIIPGFSEAFWGRSFEQAVLTSEFLGHARLGAFRFLHVRLLDTSLPLEKLPPGTGACGKR